MSNGSVSCRIATREQDRLSFLKTPSDTGSRPVGAFETTAEEEIDSQYARVPGKWGFRRFELVSATPCMGLARGRPVGAGLHSSRVGSDQAAFQLKRYAPAEGVTESGQEEKGDSWHAGEGIRRSAERPRILCGTRFSGGTGP